MGEQVNKRGSTARLQVTPSKIPKKVEQSADPERRIAKRVLKIQPCVYQLAQVNGYEIVELSNGPALSINASEGGFLLLMPRSPRKKQVFEVHTPLQTEKERTVKLVEACWTRKLSFGPIGQIYLVGVRSLFEPARFSV